MKKSRVGEKKIFPRGLIRNNGWLNKKFHKDDIVEVCEVGKHVTIIQPIGRPLERVEADSRRVTLLPKI